MEIAAADSDSISATNVAASTFKPPSTLHLIPAMRVALQRVLSSSLQNESSQSSTLAIDEWKRLPHSYRTDVNFLLCYIPYAKVLPPTTDFERTWPPAVRWDKRIVLALVERDDFASILYPQRHLYAPEMYTNDKQVMLAYCQKIPRALQDCSEDLVNDIDVVTAAVQLNGLALQYASRELQGHEDLIRLACRTCANHAMAASRNNSINGGNSAGIPEGGTAAAAFDLCPPGPVRTQLLHDVDFGKLLLQQPPPPKATVIHASADEAAASSGSGTNTNSSTAAQHTINSNTSRRIWNMLPSFWHERIDLSYWAVRYGGVPLRCIKAEFASLWEFNVAAVHFSSTVYHTLDASWQNDVRVICAAICAPDSTPTLLETLLYKPEFINHRNGTVENATTSTPSSPLLQGISLERDVNDPTGEVALLEAIIDRAFISTLKHFVSNHRPDLISLPTATAMARGQQRSALAILSLTTRRQLLVRAVRRDPELYTEWNLAEVSDWSLDAELFMAAMTYSNAPNPHAVLKLLHQRRTQWGIPAAVRWAHRHVEVIFHALSICTHPSHLSQVYTLTRIPTENVAVPPAAAGGAAGAAAAAVGGAAAAVPAARRAGFPLALIRHNFDEDGGVNDNDEDNVWASNRDLQRLFISKGGRIYPELQYPTLQTDRELALLVAQYNPSELDKIGASFLNDYAFVMQAVTLNGLCLRFMPASMHTNMDLAVQAIATSHVHAIQTVSYSVNHRVRWTIPRTMAAVITKESVYAHVQEQLTKHQVFVQDFLGGFMAPLPSLQDHQDGGDGDNVDMNDGNPADLSKTNLLPLLECGMETGTALKQLIASFVGVPMGEVVAAYRTCLDYLSLVVGNNSETGDGTAGGTNSNSTASRLPLPYQPPSVANEDEGIRILDPGHEPFWNVIHQHRRHHRRLMMMMMGDDDDFDDLDMDDNAVGAAGAAAAPAVAQANAAVAAAGRHRRMPRPLARMGANRPFGMFGAAPPAAAAAAVAPPAGVAAAAAAAPVAARRERDDPFDRRRRLMQRMAPARADPFADDVFDARADPFWDFEDDEEDDMLMQHHMAAQMHFDFMQRRRDDAMNRGVAGAAAAPANAAAAAPAMGVAMGNAAPAAAAAAAAPRPPNAMAILDDVEDMLLNDDSDDDMPPLGQFGRRGFRRPSPRRDAMVARGAVPARPAAAAHVVVGAGGRVAGVAADPPGRVGVDAEAAGVEGIDNAAAHHARRRAIMRRHFLFGRDHPDDDTFLGRFGR